MENCSYDNQEAIWGAILYSPENGIPTVEEIANRIEYELKLERYAKQGDKMYVYKYDAVVIIMEGKFITDLIYSKEDFYKFLERNAKFLGLFQRL